MFWGLVLKTNKRYSQQVSKAFHVSQAVLDLSTLNPNDIDAVVQVWLTTDDTDHLIANVGRKTSHVQLDLTFTEGETVAFYSKGSGTVHLTGYLLPDDDDFGDYPMDGEEEESDVEVQSTRKKQKIDKKQVKVVKDDEDEEDDEEDDSWCPEMLEEEEDEDDDGEKCELSTDDDEEDDDDDDDDDEDEDDDENDDDANEEDSDEIQAPQSKKAKIENVATKQNGLSNGKVSKKEIQNQKNQQKIQKQDKQEQKQKQQQQNQQKKPEKKTLKGGVIIEDLRVGKGPEAQAGKKVFVYYEGRLKSNNSTFDSTKSGEGFKFTLGRGEVIQGWDIGVAGMKVGSKRRITCPPNVAYGHKGAPPQIPGNATLVFDVEVRNIK